MFCFIETYFVNKTLVAIIRVELCTLQHFSMRSHMYKPNLSLLSHRLNTIMDSDRVLVMHAGKVVEFDSPDALRQKEDSVFLKLLRGGEE